MEKIKSTDFYAKWLETVCIPSRKSDMQKLWRRNVEFTNYIKGSENSVVGEVASKLNILSYEQDYYSLDAVFYYKDDLVPGLSQNSHWFRDIRIAFEHENAFRSGLYQEVSHLLITNCDLRVLVTYPDVDEPKEMLDYLHNLIKETRHSESLSTNESFLLIFGYEGTFEWEGYVYNENVWIKLENTKNDR